MPLQPTVTCPAVREYAQQGPRQRLNAGVRTSVRFRPFIDPRFWRGWMIDR
jgi:hypothetical protein